MQTIKHQTIKDLVQKRTVEFVRLDRTGENAAVWYRVTPSSKIGGRANESGLTTYETEWLRLPAFEFPIPLEETAGAEFLATDKAIVFMRWIRRHVELLNEAKQAAEATQ